MLTRLLGWLLIASASLTAQTVRVANFGPDDFDGWKRCTVDVMPPHKAGELPDGTRYVIGRAIGADARVIDLRLKLASGDVATLNLAKSREIDFAVTPLAADTLGQPTLAGQPLALISARQDGAGHLLHYRGRSTAMLNADLWVVWYPDRPAVASGEIVVCASNPAVSDPTAVVPDKFTLQFGSTVLVPGAQGGGPCLLLPQGTVLGDGQARSFPITVLWMGWMTKDQWGVAAAGAALSVSANGIERLYPDGNPASRMAPLAWTRQHRQGAIDRLHTWAAGPLGVAARSGDTGAQEDQVWPGGECMQGEASLGAETVRYLVALGQSRRPCHHLETDGELLRIDEHPQLVIWTGRPHYDRRVSPDQLGKSRKPTIDECHGWEGPDREHWLLNTLAIAHRLIGSPALEWQLQAQSRLFLFQETTDPRLSTSGWSAERAVGWAGIVAVHLARSLPPAMAARIADRWRARVRLVYLPQLSTKPQGIWYPRNDPRLTADTGWQMSWMPYQQAVGAFGLGYACRHLGPVEGVEFAHEAALVVLDAWEEQTNGAFKPWAYLGFAADSAAVPRVEGAGAHYGAGVWVWMVPAIATVAEYDHANEKAAAIWRQVQTQADPHWLPPGVEVK